MAATMAAQTEPLIPESPDISHFGTDPLMPEPPDISHFKTDPLMPEPPDISHFKTDPLMPEPPDISHTETDPLMPEPPDISHIETEDDTPVDNIFSEKQQRLLARSLNCSWNPGRPFIAASDVGLFFAVSQPPVVPDMFMSLDVRYPEDIWKKKNRSYFLWEYGKPPEVAVEIVSNTKGGEATVKTGKYARAGVWYYIIFDPQRLIQGDVLRMYELHAGKYIPLVGSQLSRIGLGTALWEGCFEGMQAQWLRWCDHKGKLIETGEERTQDAEQKAEKERQKAEKEQQKAEKEQQKAEKEQQKAEKERQKTQDAEQKAEKERQKAEKERQKTEKERQRAENAEQRNLGAAHKMLADGLEPDMIMKYTGLSAEEIACLSDSGKSA